MPVHPAFDQRMMRRCIELAAAAASCGNTPVGCVITLEGRVVAEAEEQSPAGSNPFAHAEILAVVAALQSLSRTKLPGATLYTTNEPCFLCSYAIREAQITRVVFAVETRGGWRRYVGISHFENAWNRWLGRAAANRAGPARCRVLESPRASQG